MRSSKNSLSKNTKNFFKSIKDSGYPNIKFDKDVDFEKMYNEKFN